MIPPPLTHLEHAKMFAFMLHRGDICRDLDKFPPDPVRPNYMIYKKTLYFKYL
jgi:hypothetical protein